MMSSPEMAGATKPSLTQDWLSALRYWLRGRTGVIAAIVLAVVIGAALNWSWLVAVGIAPASSGRAAVRRHVRTWPLREQDARQLVFQRDGHDR
jgi:hypothetical protein